MKKLLMLTLLALSANFVQAMDADDLVGNLDVLAEAAGQVVPMQEVAAPQIPVRTLILGAEGQEGYVQHGNVETLDLILERSEEDILEAANLLKQHQDEGADAIEDVDTARAFLQGEKSTNTIATEVTVQVDAEQADRRQQAERDVVQHQQQVDAVTVDIERTQEEIAQSINQEQSVREYLAQAQAHGHQMVNQMDKQEAQSTLAHITMWRAQARAYLGERIQVREMYEAGLERARGVWARCQAWLAQQEERLGEAWTYARQAVSAGIDWTWDAASKAMPDVFKRFTPTIRLFKANLWAFRNDPATFIETHRDTIRILATTGGIAFAAGIVMYVLGLQSGVVALGLVGNVIGNAGLGVALLSSAALIKNHYNPHNPNAEQDARDAVLQAV